MSTPWHPPAGEPTAPTAVTSAVAARATSPTEVATQVFEDLKAHPVGYFLAGTSYLAVVCVAVFVSLALLGLSVAPGLLLEDETLTVVGGIVGFLLYMVAILGIAMVGYPIFTLSLLRGLDKQHRGEGSIGFLSLYDDRAGSWNAVVFYLLSQLLILVGVLLLYIPGLIAMALSFFALPIVVFEGATPTEALGLGWRHMKSDPGWHVAVWVLLMVAAIVLEITLIGVLLIFPVMVAWQLTAYRAAFGPEGARAWAARLDA